MPPLIFKAVQCFSEKAVIQPNCPCFTKISLPCQTFPTKMICCKLMRKRFTAPNTERSSNVVYLRQTIRTDSLFISTIVSTKRTPGRIHKIYYCIDNKTHCRHSTVRSKSKVFRLYTCFSRAVLMVCAVCHLVVMLRGGLFLAVPDGKCYLRRIFP